MRAELVDHVRFATRADALRTIGDYIDNFYNVERRHSHLDYLSPITSSAACGIVMLSTEAGELHSSVRRALTISGNNVPILRRSAHVVAVLGLVSAACGRGEPGAKADAGNAGFGSVPADRSISPSMVELIAMPERIKGALVSVSGFYVRDTEPKDGILFLDEDSARMLIFANAVHVEFGSCRLVQNAKGRMYPLEAETVHNGYVTITGIFEPTQERWTSRYVGSICSVVSVRSLQPYPIAPEGPTASPGKGTPPI